MTRIPSNFMKINTLWCRGTPFVWHWPSWFTQILQNILFLRKNKISSRNCRILIAESAVNRNEERDLAKWHLHAKPLHLFSWHVLQMKCESGTGTQTLRRALEHARSSVLRTHCRKKRRQVRKNNEFSVKQLENFPTLWLILISAVWESDE